MLPGTSLTTGQWVRVADPDDPVDCNNVTNDSFLCTNVTSPDATLSLYHPAIIVGLGNREGFYKCCLPTNCSTANNSIYVNIFSKHYHPCTSA